MRQKPPWEAERAGIRNIEKIAPSRIHFKEIVFFYFFGSGTIRGSRADLRPKNGFPAYWPYTTDRKIALLGPWGPQIGQNFNFSKSFAFQDHFGSDSCRLSALQRLSSAPNQKSRVDPKNPKKGLGASETLLIERYGHF